jgi:hypothetical protein
MQHSPYICYISAGKNQHLVESSLRMKKENNRYLSKSFPLLLMKGDMDEQLLLKYFTFLLEKINIC